MFRAGVWSNWIKDQESVYQSRKKMSTPAFAVRYRSLFRQSILGLIIIISVVLTFERSCCSWISIEDGMNGSRIYEIESA
jgi:hypothetical protein